MRPLLFVLNGPNINMLGLREPAVYGADTFADVIDLCRRTAAEIGVDVDVRQTNHEGVLVDWIQEARGKAAGIVLNPGAYTHTSIAIHDAIRVAECPVVELHITNVFAREAFRHHSYVSPVAKGVMCGFGIAGYGWAMRALAGHIRG